MESLKKILAEAERARLFGAIARRCEVTEQAVRNWRSGRNVPGADKLSGLAEVTGRDVYDLLGIPRPGGPAGLSDAERLLVATVRILGVDPEDALRAIYRAPRPEPALDRTVNQLNAYNLTPPAVDEDAEPPAADGHDDEARPGPRRKA